MACPLRTSLISLVVALAAAGSALAQSGTVTGKVTSSEGGGPVAGAAVNLEANGVLAAQGRTRGDGAYRISGVAPGTYTVRVLSVGYAPREFPGTVVSAGGTATVDAVLTQQAMRLEDVSVTTVSKVEEKQTEAPAAVFAMSRQEIDERPALTVADHLKSMPGADVAQGGLVQSNVVARGFNNIFSGALLTLIDYRYAAVPSLRVNVATFFPTTNEDIEKIEFVLGPGAALYGPNAANGVLNILTRSPFSSTGTTVALEAGMRAGSTERVCNDALCSDPTFTSLDGAQGLWRVTGRHAMRLGSKVAFKVSGNYLKGTEWQARDVAEPADLDAQKPGLEIPAGRCNSTTGCRDFNLEQWGGEARMDVRPDLSTEIIATYGMTNARNLIEYTGIGAGQARDWKYSAAQLRFRHKRFFAQGFGNFSDAGSTFLLRDGNPLVDNSRVWSAQFQHGFDLLNGKETLLYGVDYIVTDARTGGTINGSFEDDDGIKEIGGYVHSVSRLTPKLDFVGALRVDKHSRLEDAVWSPRAALVFKPAENQSIRLTFNRAFSTPTSNNLFLDISAGRIPETGNLLYTVRALGVPKEGFQFRVNGGCAGGLDNLCMRTPFQALLPSGTPALLPAQAAALWGVAVGAVAPFIAAMPGGASIVALLTDPSASGYVAPPSADQVPTQLRVLNTTTKQFIDVEPSYVQDIERLKPTINHGIELGYKALLGNRFQISVDGWYEKKRNFTGPLLVESPTVFLNTSATIAYLSSKLLAILTPTLGAQGAAEVIQKIGVGMAGVSGATSLENTGVPLATVVPTNSALTERPDIFLTYRNFGEIDFWGADLALDYVLGNHWAFSGSYSYVNKDYFPGAASDRPADVALNASKSKGTFTVAYHDEPGGWSAEGRFRAVKGFPVNSGVYVSAPDPGTPGKLLPIDSYGVIDVQGTWRPPVGARNMLVSLNVQNLFNKHYATFVGVPNLGRFLLTKVSYTF
jgi:iron complex outermembrane receptor protein